MREKPVGRSFLQLLPSLHIYKAKKPRERPRGEHKDIYSEWVTRRKYRIWKFGGEEKMTEYLGINWKKKKKLNAEAGEKRVL